MMKLRKLCLTAQIRFSIVMATRREAATSFAATAQEHADDAGDGFPLLDASCHDVPLSTILLSRGIPAPHAWRIPSDTRDHASPIGGRSEMRGSRQAGELRLDDRASDLACELRRHVACCRQRRAQRKGLEANRGSSTWYRDGDAEDPGVCR